MTKAEKFLEALYAELPKMQCKGKCQDSCHSVGLAKIEQDVIKKRHGICINTGLYIESGCPALGMFGQCQVYPDRPLICRLWGMLESMRCPWGCLPEGGLLSEEQGSTAITRTLTFDKGASEA